MLKAKEENVMRLIINQQEKLQCIFNMESQKADIINAMLFCKNKTAKCKHC